MPRKDPSQQVLTAARAGATAASRPSRFSEVPFAIYFGAGWMLVAAALSSIGVGPFSLSAILTMILAAMVLTWLPAYGVNSTLTSQPTRYTARTRVPWTLWAFVFMATIGSVLLNPIAEMDSLTVQNLVIYFLFVGVIVSVSATKSHDLAERGWVLMRSSATAAAYVYFGVAALRLETFMGVRTLAMSGIIVLATVISGPPRNIWIKWAPYVVVSAMALSLSRTATIIGFALLSFMVIRSGSKNRKAGSRLLKAATVLVVAGIAVGAIILYYTPFRNRFLVGDNAVRLGDLSLSTMGRSKMWELMLSDPANWLLGHGVGSATQLINERLPGLTHPHNEYLRFYYDFGMIGLALFVVGYCSLGYRAYRNARRTEHPVHWSAFIALLGIGLNAITDNCFVYPFVVVPLACLVGLSMAIARFETPSPRVPDSLGGEVYSTLTSNALRRH